MGANTAIEWTDATWNPVRGCSRVSPGCGGPGKAGGCYAEKIAARFSGAGQAFHGFARRVNGEARWTGKVARVDNTLPLPLSWKEPRRIFVNSMSDLFHENLPDEDIDEVFAVMALCPQHTFQVLTKRHNRMRAWAERNATGGRIFHLAGEIGRPKSGVWPLPNVWLGVSAEDQERWDERLADLAATPAAVRFVSCEPLLGAIDAGNAFDPPPENSPYKPIDWVICGGESGPEARPMHPDWPRSLRDQCAAAGVPFFFKQWGEWKPVLGPLPTDSALEPDGLPASLPDIENDRVQLVDRDGRIVPDYPERDPGADLWFMERVGKKAAGAMLDGREHRAFPSCALRASEGTPA